MRKVAASGMRRGQVPQDGPGRAQQAKNREIRDLFATIYHTAISTYLTVFVC